MNRILRFLFFALLVRPFLILWIGFNIRRRHLLPREGPAIVVANHNSHLDTPVLMSLLPMRKLGKIHPVAAAGYFLKNRFLAWFATRIIGIIPITLGSGRPREEVLAEVFDALRDDAIIILFPEGTRGEPEKFGRFKSGVASLLKLMPQVPVHPIYLHGLGKALPKGELLIVPFFCDGFVGEALNWNGSEESFMAELDAAMQKLAAEGKFSQWE